VAWRATSELILREAVAIARQSALIPQPGPTVREYGQAEHLTVFVHGYMASGGVFNPLAQHLAERGIAPRQLHFSYWPAGSVDELARRLGAAISAVQGDGPVHIVGHSLGGLVARYYRQVLRRRLDRLVCLASPHQGTTRAQPWTSLPLAREIAPGSATLRLLAATRARLEGVRVCSVVAEGDGIVAPVDSAVLEGHEVCRLDAVGHHAILFDPRAWALVERVLTEPWAYERELPRARAAGG
jgi:triacylglycerol lipase